MKTTILFFAFLVTCVSTAQDFELIKPNKKDLRTKFQENSSLDIIYLYLSNNFTSITGKQNVKKIDKNNTQPCSFTETFSNTIKYSYFSCEEEEGGVTTLIEFPKIEKNKITNWIEQIYEVDLTDIPNEWNSNKSEYRPKDKGAGCYFILKSKKDKWLIEVSCGC
ncbi:MAG: hypothetical protein HWD82_04280 [Flavobacteriaceae bacterium]|nr:hypothetical protein [Flavobacteriaceae bacterium]